MTYQSSFSETNHWYSARDDDDAHSALVSTVRKIANQHNRRRADDVHFMRMYGQRDIYGKGENLDVKSENRLKFNLVRSCVNTAAAHIGALKPKPRFQTDDAEWDLIQKAKSCEHAVGGVFNANDFYELATEAFVDSAVSSLGGVKVYGKDGKVVIERTFPGEILVDMREGYYGKPKNLYQAKLVDKQVLKEAYPDKTTEIDASQTTDLSLFDWVSFQYESTEDQVLVIEAWHLGTYDRKTDTYKGGKHTIAVLGGLLEPVEEWAWGTFPFAFLRWNKRQAGFYGMGIVEELRDYQWTINYIHLKLRDMMHYLSRGKLVTWDNPNTKVNAEHLTTAPWDVLKIKGTGQPPMVVAQNAVPTEWWSWRREVIQDAFVQIGFNEMQRSGEKPPGVESGVALREVQEVGSKRARRQIQAFERWVVGVARLVIECLRRMDEAGELEPIQVTLRKAGLTRMQMVNWSEVALDRDQFQLEVMPASSLPDSTPGRTQTIQDWYQAGFITQQEAKALLDVPDLERFKSLDLAAYENILNAVEIMLEDGEYIFPEPTDDLELALKLVTQSYNKFRLRKAPEERLELLRRYLDDVQHLINRATQQATPMQQQAAEMGPAVASIQQAVPGGATPHQAAQLMEAAAAQRVA